MFFSHLKSMSKLFEKLVNVFLKNCWESRILVQTSTRGICSTFFTLNNLSCLPWCPGVLLFFFFLTMDNFQLVYICLHFFQQFHFSFHLSLSHGSHATFTGTKLKKSCSGSVRLVEILVPQLVFISKAQYFEIAGKVSQLQLRLEFMGYLKKYYKQLPVLIGSVPT